MKNILLFLLILSSFQLISQNTLDSVKYSQLSPRERELLDSIKAIYEKETIFIDGNNNYIKHNISYKLGFFGKKLKNELSKSRDASIEHLFYRKHLIRCFELYFGGLIGTVVVTAATLNPVGLLFLIPVFISFSELNKAILHYNRSIWVYNRDMLLLKIQDKLLRR